MSLKIFFLSDLDFSREELVMVGMGVGVGVGLVARR
jgi:hypothetical protein